MKVKFNGDNLIRIREGDCYKTMTVPEFRDLCGPEVNYCAIVLSNPKRWIETAIKTFEINHLVNNNNRREIT